MAFLRASRSGASPWDGSDVNAIGSGFLESTVAQSNQQPMAPTATAHHRMDHQAGSHQNGRERLIFVSSLSLQQSNHSKKHQQRRCQ